MRKKMLRSVLVVAVSAVAAFGALAGVYGAQGDAHDVVVGVEVGPAVVAGGEAVGLPADSKWD
ncbi:hypothetical protein [Streptomyces parvulus]|uniref:Uncharacterized protein n=1 Tax=Streptomyces parvulus TaxID=146923 RepID=A0A369VA86_9ACTN|nr:hypothetical protein [Streptomyces parvulus]RDD89393.1 hypothetical protein DVZ84_10435 [Streptomyces parvulus]